MGIFRPQQQSTGGNKYMGVVETAIAEYTDRSSEFDWADVFIEVTLNIKDSQYTRPLRIAGALDKNTEGKVTGGSVLNRLYKFFDVIKCKAGLNVSGEWEDENGEKINDISDFLNQNYKTDKYGYSFLAYIYKAKPKNPGDKVYTRVHPRLFDNSKEGEKDIAENIAWLRSKGYLKEAESSDMTPVSNHSMSDNAIGNL